VRIKCIIGYDEVEMKYADDYIGAVIKYADVNSANLYKIADNIHKISVDRHGYTQEQIKTSRKFNGQ